MDRVHNLLEQIQNRLDELNKAERKVADLKAAHESWFPNYMAGEIAA